MWDCGVRSIPNLGLGGLSSTLGMNTLMYKTMMKKVDFSLDLLKKIVSGEVKGKAIHIDGNNEEGEITKVLDYWNGE